MSDLIKKPLLSIIVPIYNVEEFLEECINSILVQKFIDYELILVDDGSPDNCGEICEEYALKDSRIILIHKKNGGLSSARNAGIDIARGSYLSFIDSDDFISTDFYLANMSYLTSHLDVDMLISQVCYYDNVENKIIYNKATEFSTERDILNHMFSVNYIGSAWINIYKKQIFLGLRYPEGRIFEDGFILPEIVNKIEKLYISNIGIYYYRSRENSITKTKMTMSSFKQELDSCNNIIKYSVEKKLEKKIYIRHFLDYTYILFNAVKFNGENDFLEYIAYWNEYPFTVFDCIYVRSFKSFILFLMLKVLGFKNVSNIIT